MDHWRLAHSKSFDDISPERIAELEKIAQNVVPGRWQVSYENNKIVFTFDVFQELGMFAPPGHKNVRADFDWHNNATCLGALILAKPDRIGDSA